MELPQGPDYAVTAEAGATSHLSNLATNRDLESRNVPRELVPSLRLPGV
jgi:hypothetical protein